MFLYLKYKNNGEKNMHKNFQRFLSKSLAFILLSSLLTGCSFGKSSSVSSNVTGIEKPKKITAMFDIIVKEEDGQDNLVKEYKKQTGIDLIITQPPHNQYQEKLKLAFSSNSVPDIVEVSNSDYVSLSVQGAFIPLDSYISASAPIGKIDKSYIDAVRLKDGKVYGFPLSKGGGTVTYIRKDWLDNLGMKVPATWDELYEVMKAFTYNDPDKNGKNDTFGYTAAGLGSGSEAYLRDFLQQATFDFTLKDGKWVDGFTQPEVRDALLRLKKAYSDNVLDPEFFTNQTSNMREKFYNGNAGILNYWSGAWAANIEESTKLSSSKKAEVVAIPTIKDSFYNNRISPIQAITSSAKNPDGIFKWFIEYIHDGGKGQMLFTHGVEGVHYKIENNKYTVLPFKVNSSIKFDTAYINAELNLTPWNDPIEQDPRVTESININMANAVQLKLLPQSNTYLKHASELSKLKEDIISRIMTGEITIDAGLGLYSSKAATLEISKILSEFNN